MSAPVSAKPGAPQVNVTVGSPTREPRDQTRPARRRARTALATWHWRHTPVWAVLNLAGAALAVAAIGYAASVPAVVAVFGTVAGAVGAVVAGLLAEHRQRRLIWRAICWAAAGTWVTWTLATTPWAVLQLGMLAAGTMAAALVAPELTRRRRRATAVSPTADGNDPQVRRERVKVAWEARIQRVCDVQVTVLNIATWPTGTGYTLDVRMPTGGTSWRTLDKHSVELADDADLPQGCPVVAKPGRWRRRSVLLEVSTHNALRDLHKLTDTSALTIDEPFPIGKLLTGDDATVHLAQEGFALAGQVGSGKTNALNVLTGQLARCVDVLIWHIDLAGAGLSRPWVTPAHEGRAPMSAVDWVATTEVEALLMTQAAIQIIDGRKRGYARRMRDANADVLPVDQQVPQIVILVDEGGKLPAVVRNNLITISDTGRAARVRTGYCALRAVDDYIPTEVKDQARTRVTMRVSEEKELAFMFGWGNQPDPSAAPYPGCGFLFQGSEEASTLVPFKAFRMEPADIDAMAVATAELRPALDEISLRLADTVTLDDDQTGGLTRHGLSYADAYSGRWRRALPLLFADDDGDHEMSDDTNRPEHDDEPARTEDKPATGSGSDISGAFDLIPGDTPAKALERFKAAKDNLEKAAEDDPLIEQQFAAIVGNLDAEAIDPHDQPPAAPAGQQRPEPRDRYQHLLQEAGERGTGATEIAATLQSEGHRTNRTTVQGWLTTDAAKGLVAKNEAGRWVWRGDA